jgi:hypothetical protein
MSFRLSTLITAGLLGVALAGTGNAIAGHGEGSSCGDKEKGETSAAVERSATGVLAAQVLLDHLV